MSYKILSKDGLAPGIFRMVLEAPEVVRNAQPGQFVVVIPDDKGERVPLTIADSDKAQGALTIIFQEAGFSTQKMARMEPGASLFAVLGPLGRPSHIAHLGTVVGVAGGVGIAEILPVMRAYKQAGNHVIGLIGARTKGLLVLEDALKSACDEVRVATNDGTCGFKGFVTDLLNDMIGKERIDLVYAVGPVPMMKRACELTRPKAIKTVVSLNPVMVDATGMCGVCRCKVAGKTVFGCVDGPEFDGHAVDLGALEKRLKFFAKEESWKASSKS